MAEIFHEGVIRRSGRYPWGSGKNPHQRSLTFLSMVSDLEAKGMTRTEIARHFGMTTTELRATNAIAKNQKRAADAAQVVKLQDKGWSNVAIGQKMGINESSVRALASHAMQDRAQILNNTVDVLRRHVDEKGSLEIGIGVEHHLGISRTKLMTAAAALKDEGYVQHKFSVDQLGTGKKTTYIVLAPEGTTYPEILKKRDNNEIGTVTSYSEDGGRTFLNIKPPAPVSSKRIEVRYGPDGGAEMDGVIQLRRGVDELSLGQSRYAQVRIAVDKNHYLKGMAVYADDLPDGIDIRFNTNKTDKGDKLLAMKDMRDEKTGEIDKDNPFGAIVRQFHYTDPVTGRKKLSPLNIVGSENPDGESTSGEEGGWSKWSSKLSSQMLSKQNPSLIKEQLDLTYNIRKSDYDEIMSLTNPVVKRKLLETFAEESDSAAVYLKAAGLPRTKTHVILPVNSLKDDEVYAPWYRDGESVVLIRHPHGGIFEIPELRVNNRNREARTVISDGIDAIGINARVAERLSGADFDGDTVLVIPNNSGKVKTAPALEGLVGFDPRRQYPAYEGMKVMSNTQQAMGDISNLITDMSIQGAPNDELARAVRHSMVVIDAEKHKLNYRQSAQDNNIQELKRKYQPNPDGRPPGGASTLISRAKSQERVPDRKPRPAAEGGSVDRTTGERVYVPTGATITRYAKDPTTGKPDYSRPIKTEPKLIKSTKMAEARDARTLMSSREGTARERIYANHANQLKDLANKARLAAIRTTRTETNTSAKQTYKQEVDELRQALRVALENAPRERAAQLYASSIVKAKRQENPSLTDAEIKKLNSQALAAARRRTGAKKDRIEITPLQWEAIQNGAVTDNLLSQILNHTDLDLVRQYALPREASVMSDARLARARNMLANGYDPGDIAEALGVAPSTLASALEKEA